MQCRTVSIISAAFDPSLASAANLCCDAQRCPLVGFVLDGSLHETPQIHRIPRQRGHLSANR
jgi:hypothetical protein